MRAQTVTDGMRSEDQQLIRGKDALSKNCFLKKSNNILAISRMTSPFHLTRYFNHKGQPNKGMTPVDEEVVKRKF